MEAGEKNNDTKNLKSKEEAVYENLFIHINM